MPIRILTLLTMATCASAASEVPIIWEQQIFDLNRYAASLLDEAYRMFESPTSDWDVVGTYNRGLQVFSRPVQGSKVSSYRSLNSHIQLSSLKAPASTPRTQCTMLVDSWLGNAIMMQLPHHNHVFCCRLLNLSCLHASCLDMYERRQCIHRLDWENLLAAALGAIICGSPKGRAGSLQAAHDVGRRCCHN